MIQKPGVNINLKSNQNVLIYFFFSYHTALDFACKYDHIDIVDLLLHQNGIEILHDDVF